MKRLLNRSVLRVSGSDSTKFLQSILTQNVHSLSPSKPIASCLLSSKGRILADMIVHDGSSISLNAEPNVPSYLVDHDSSVSDRILRSLSLLKMRSNVKLELLPSSSHGVYVDISKQGNDPRLSELGDRFIKPVVESDADGTDAYHRHRLMLGVPEGSMDLGYDIQTPLEANMDLLHAVVFDKGCYIGQELTARTHFTGVIRKRLLSIMLDPAKSNEYGSLIGADIVSSMDLEKAVGSVRSIHSNLGMAVLRLAPVLSPDSSLVVKTSSSTLVPVEQVIWPNWLEKPTLEEIQ